MRNEVRNGDEHGAIALSSLGGRPTLIAGAAFLALQVLLATLVWLAVRNLDSAATNSLQYERASGHLQETLRGINELVVTEGAAASRDTARAGLASLRKISGDIDMRDSDSSKNVDFPALDAAIVTFLEIGKPSPSDVDAMISLGKISGKASNLVDLLKQRAQEAAAVADKAKRLAYLLAIASGVIAVAGTFGIYWLFFVRVTRPLRTTVGAAAQIARGNLGYMFSEKGSGEARELVRTLALMQSNLGAIVTDTREMSGEVVDSSKQLASAAADLSARTEHQASTLEETASSMEEFAAAIRQTAEHTRQATVSAGKAIESAEHGRMVVMRTAERMSDIHASAKKITEITNIIDSIAFQTNILALNAAVEAARAGEQGRGFAVVASEVRALAQRSAASAKDIKKLIEETVNSVEAGNALVADTGVAMNRIVESSQSVCETVREIDTAATEQATNVGHVKKAIEQLDSVTQQNASLVEQVAATAAALGSNAESLSTVVARFVLDDRVAYASGNNRANPERPPATEHRPPQVPSHVNSRTRTGIAPRAQNSKAIVWKR